MVTVFFTNGHSAQIAEATSTRQEEPTGTPPAFLRLLNAEGKVVASFRADHVDRYTVDS